MPLKPEAARVTMTEPRAGLAAAAREPMPIDLLARTAAMVSGCCVCVREVIQGSKVWLIGEWVGCGGGRSG